MTTLDPRASLKEINAHKKRINWGDVPTIFHMVSSSIGDADSILLHGFDSGYKRVLQHSAWNLPIFEPYKDNKGNLKVKNKPDVILLHQYNDMGYELHFFPVVNGELVKESMVNNPKCPFVRWYPESMQMLFRINSLVAFSIFTFKSGDEADLALLRFAHQSVNKLIANLEESFHIIDVKGYNIAQFYQEITNRNGDILNPEVSN